MNEAERIRLYNDLCDFEQDLHQISYPPKTREIDILRRAIIYVRGRKGKWLLKNATAVLDENNRAVDYMNCVCDKCGFAGGRASFTYCPNCNSKMK